MSFFKWILPLLLIIQGDTLMAAEKEKVLKKGDYKCPWVGFGTYPLKGKECTQALSEAIKAGYRVIDTATYYQNFKAIREAMKTCNRNHFYIISKVWPDSHTPSKLVDDLELTFRQLQTDYIDAYLLHWPNSKVNIKETLEMLDICQREGFIRHIGLSNVTVHHLRRALEMKVPITWVQVEMNPFFYDATLLDYCKLRSILVQAWAPLARGRVIGDPFLSEIGRKYGKTAAQVAIRWVLQHGVIPLPGSHDPKHIKENINVFDFVLTNEEMAAIDERAKTGKRERVTEEMGIGFTDEFDFSYEKCWPSR